MRQTLGVVGLVLLAACGSAADRADTTAARTDTSGMAAMSGMNMQADAGWSV